MPVTSAGSTVGETTSGTFSPTLRTGIALALLDTAAGLSEGDVVAIDVRGRPLECEVVSPPFVPPTCGDMSFPTESAGARRSEAGIYRFRAEAEQAGPAVFTAPGDVVGGGFGLFESAATPGASAPSRTTTGGSRSRSG